MTMTPQHQRRSPGVGDYVTYQEAEVRAIARITTVYDDADDRTAVDLEVLTGQGRWEQKTAVPHGWQIGCWRWDAEIARRTPNEQPGVCVQNTRLAV